MTRTAAVVKHSSLMHRRCSGVRRPFVRTNHVHVVVAVADSPGKILGGLKAWATRRLVEAQHRAQGMPVWARQGGTRTLWNAKSIEAACSYVRYEQGEIAPGSVWPPP